MNSVEVSGVSRRFGAYLAADEIDLTVQEGEFVALVGPSGCGKSTLLRMIAGLDTPDMGTIRVAGQEVSEIRPASRNVAMVFQNYALYPHLTVRQNMATPLMLRRLCAWERLPLLWRTSKASRGRRAEIDTAVIDAARALGLEALLNRRPVALSGGQRQRVALGRAVVRQPSVFLYDEPLSNLDAELRASMRTEIVELHRRLDVATVYVTHDQVEAMTMADRIAVMRAGKILQFGTPEELYRAPSCLEVARTLGTPCISTLPGRVGPLGEIQIGDSATLPVYVPRPGGTQVTLGLRAEYVTLAHSNAPHTFMAEVRNVEYLGSDTLIHVDVSSDGTTSPARLIARATRTESRNVHVGDPLRLAIDPENVLVFDEGGSRLDQTALQRPASRQACYA